VSQIQITGGLDAFINKGKRKKEEKEKRDREKQV
jgi:hypothetical protein